MGFLKRAFRSLFCSNECPGFRAFEPRSSSVRWWRLTYGERLIMKNLDLLKTEVAQAVTVMQSSRALIAGMKTRLDEALAHAADTGELDQLRELSETLGTETDALSAAVVANTPVEGDPEEVQPDPATPPA